METVEVVGMVCLAIVAGLGSAVGGWSLLTDEWPEKLRSKDDE
jgi:hypothetical protein